MQQRAQVPVQCPACNWRHFLEIEVEERDLVAAAELRKHLEEWLRSRCPEHLGPVMETMKN
jgi:hypothetical protein